jgi:hypothetical protein
MRSVPGRYQYATLTLCKGMSVQSTPGPASPAKGAAPPPGWERPAGPPTVPSPQHRAVPAAPLDIRSLLHPTEHSRLMIALSASAIVFGVAAMGVYALYGWIRLAEYAGYLTAFGVLIWLSLQVYRSRLLGGAVRVSEITLPELQAVVDDVRARLDYRKHVDLYVVDKVPGGSVMTSYLGTRLIEIEGGLVAELLGEEHRAELTYLVARHIGQLKARHQRLTPIFLAVSLVDSLKFLQLFLAPYFRATAKSGDQIAAACCGDIRATAATMNRLLVGKELGPRLVVEGVLDQAATVRRRWLPRLAQLFMSLPHATNRYLNLLAFFARVAPEEINDWRATLDEATARKLTAVLGAAANRRAPRRRPNPLSMLLAVVVSGGVLAGCGWLLFGHPAGLSGASAPAQVTGRGNTSQRLASSAPATAASAPATPAGTASAATQQLLAHVPAAFASTCQPVTLSVAGVSQGADAEVACQPTELGGSGLVTYTHYRTQATMQAAFAGLTQGVPFGDCTSGDSQGSYRQGSQPVGGYACVSAAGQDNFAWTDDRFGILSIASSDTMSLADLYQWWWHSDTGPE